MLFSLHSVKVGKPRTSKSKDGTLSSLRKSFEIKDPCQNLTLSFLALLTLPKVIVVTRFSGVNVTDSVIAVDISLWCPVSLAMSGFAADSVTLPVAKLLTCSTPSFSSNGLGCCRN